MGPNWPTSTTPSIKRKSIRPKHPIFTRWPIWGNSRPNSCKPRPTASGPRNCATSKFPRRPPRQGHRRQRLRSGRGQSRSRQGQRGGGRSYGQRVRSRVGTGENKPRLHRHQIARQGDGHRPPGEHRPDGRIQLERLQRGADRQGFKPLAGLGLGQRGRHRPDSQPSGYAGAVYRRCLSRRDLPRHGDANPPERDNDAKRGDLLRGGHFR